MTTIIDIVDTAVKIGLGAMIGGISSYVLAVRAQNHEKETRESNERKALVKELSLKLEKIDHLNGEGALNYHSDDVVSAKRSNVLATEVICSATALANLIGSDELVSITSEISAFLDKMYQEFHIGPPSEDRLFELNMQIENLKKSAYPFLRDLYNNA